ncbi:MFS transporter [Streptomyces stramineus]
MPALTVALVLLGLGWNFGLLSGTALVTDAVPLATRAATQGLVDVGISVSGATGGLASGMVVAVAGFPFLGAAGGVLALAIVPVVALTSRPPRPAPPGPLPARNASEPTGRGRRPRRGRDRARHKRGGPRLHRFVRTGAGAHGHGPRSVLGWLPSFGAAAAARVMPGHIPVQPASLAAPRTGA